ncbi:MAG: hypothetical protein ABIH63_04635 [archaeon]
MHKALRGGFIFGLTSAVTTTLGLMVGLNSGTHSKLVVTGAIITIAIADAFSDSLGMHLSEESENIKERAIWEATLSTFFTKLLFPLTFLIPVLLFSLTNAIIISIAWGMSCIAFFSYMIAKIRNKKPLIVIAEHLLIAVIVVVAAHYFGGLVSQFFA